MLFTQPLRLIYAARCWGSLTTQQQQPPPRMESKQNERRCVDRGAGTEERLCSKSKQTVPGEEFCGVFSAGLLHILLRRRGQVERSSANSEEGETENKVEVGRRTREPRTQSRHGQRKERWGSGSPATVYSDIPHLSSIYVAAVAAARGSLNLFPSDVVAEKRR